MIAVVGFGFASFALAGGFIAQTFEALKEGTIRSVGDLQIVDKRAIGKAEEATLEFGIPDARRARSIAAKDPDVEAVLPRIDFVGLATNGIRSVPFLGVGVDPGPEAAATLAPELVVSGKYLTGDGGEGIVLGTGLASALEVKPGDRVTLMATTRDGSLNAVDGVVEGLVDVKIKELNDRYLAGGIGLVSRLLQSPETVSKLVIFLKPHSSTRENEAAARLAKEFQAAGFPIAVRHWKELAVFYGQVRLLYIGIFGFVGAVLVVIVVLSAAIVMTMAVTERTREIGTLRALGTLPSQLLRTLALEGMVLGGVGAVTGALVALSVSMLLYIVPVQMPPPPGSSRGYPLNVTFDAGMYAATVLAMVLLAMLASAWIARKTVHTPVVEALAHT
jgi:putative ABC transport system permease protein